MSKRAYAKNKLISLMDEWVKTFDPPENLFRRECLQYEINFWKRRYKINPTPIEWKDDGRYVCHVDVPEEYEI